MSVFGTFPLQLAQAGGAETATKAAETGVPLSGWIILAGIAVVFLVPILLGNLIARLLKLKDMRARISVVLFAVTLGVAPFAWNFIYGELEMRHYKSALAEWKQKGTRTSNEITPDDAAVQKLREELPELQIEFSAPTSSAELGTSDSTPENE